MVVNTANSTLIADDMILKFQYIFLEFFFPTNLAHLEACSFKLATIVMPLHGLNVKIENTKWRDDLVLS
jgi:hypothetical protein